ncbi:uncharacterized protein LOC127568200 [Pristis pectinata]|uniref:uncharacterized protein LOC127568200 n=1 Tax=Pristis pectinata TaxID=685728 RepID=UPI00223CD775|nr:uncharacterized protein LOC127568200 [Pristis pectinata]
MRANRQQVNAKTTSGRWESMHFPFTCWEVIGGTDDKGHWQLQADVSFKCRDLDVDTIIISSHLLNTTHGASKETKFCMNEDHFSYQKGKCSSQQIMVKDLNKCAVDSESTTESSSGECSLATPVTKHTNGLQNSNIEKATSSSNQCGKHVPSVTNHQLTDNQLNDPKQVTESRSVISECHDQCHNKCSRQPLKANETSTVNQLPTCNSEGKIPTCSKIKNKNKCSEICSEEKPHWKEELFQVKENLCKRNIDSGILRTEEDSTVCSTIGQSYEDGCRTTRPMDRQINSKSAQELANFAGLSARYLAMCPLQSPFDMAREGVNIYPSGSKNNHTSDIFQSLSKERMQGKRQNYQLTRITLLEDKGTSLETLECISQVDQQGFGCAKSVATAMLLPAFRPYPSKQSLHRNKGTTKLQNQAKCLQENNSFKMYHCTPHTPDVQSVQNMAEMTLPEGHITVAQLLQTMSEGMDQNQYTIQIHSHFKEGHRTKGMKSKDLNEALFLFLQKTKKMH